jgi:hypothetical protein
VVEWAGGDSPGIQALRVVKVGEFDLEEKNPFAKKISLERGKLAKPPT